MQLRMSEHIINSGVSLSTLAHETWLSRQTITNLRDDTIKKPAFETIYKVMLALNIHKKDGEKDLKLEDMIK